VLLLFKKVVLGPHPNKFSNEFSPATQLFCRNKSPAYYNRKGLFYQLRALTNSPGWTRIRLANRPKEAGK
jgi:hypothetical protein